MEHKKAKKAKKMAEDAMRMMALEDAMAEAGEADLQPEDGYINPNPKPDGQTVIAPTGYSQYNMV